MSRTVRFGLAAAVAAVLAFVPSSGLAQQSFATGQTTAPAYEGWERNDDGSFNLVFGYMNRNWEEVIDVPVGPGNSIEPGGPDQGQPTHFYPRRNRFVFRIRVPADFGDREIIWTLTTNGQTERAYATLKRDYFIDDLVIQANYGAGGAAATTPELVDNQAPTLEVEGAGERTARVGEPVTLVAVSTDDGKPRASSMPASNPREPGPHHDRHGDRAPLLLVRLPRSGRSHVRSAPDEGLEDTRDTGGSPWSPGWETPEPPEDGRWITAVTFSEPGAYVLRGIAHDGGLATMADVIVTVTP